MKEMHHISQRYVKQCVEANRHNAVTAHYYLLLKRKVLDGEQYDYFAAGGSIKT